MLCNSLNKVKFLELKFVENMNARRKKNTSNTYVEKYIHRKNNSGKNINEKMK